jgi:hypothetical protein
MSSIPPSDEIARYTMATGATAANRLEVLHEIWGTGTRETVPLSSPMPYDLLQTDLSEFKKLSSRWQDWSVILEACAECAVQLAPTLKLPALGKDPSLGAGTIRSGSKIKAQDRGLGL